MGVCGGEAGGGKGEWIKELACTVLFQKFK